MTTPLEKNPFQEAASQYLGIVEGTVQNKPKTVITTGILEVGTIPGRHVQLGTDSANLSYVDFKSRDGFANDYDTRIVSSGGGTGDGLGGLIIQAAEVQAWAPMRIGSSFARAFKLDYGQIGPLGAVLNPQTPIVFAVGLFATNPAVYMTVQSPIANEANAQNCFVESITPAGCNAQFIGVPNSTAPGTFINWLALGL
jgi:hypothetical protein